MQKRIYTDEFKDQILKEVEETGNASLVGRKHGISRSLISKWKKDKKPAAKEQFQKKTIEKYALKECNGSYEDKKQNEKLKRLLGERELEIAVLRDLLKKTNTPLPARLG